MAATLGLSGNPGMMAVWGQRVGSRYPWPVSVEFELWRSGLGGGAGPRWGSSCRVLGPGYPWKQLLDTLAQKGGGHDEER